ncbi:MAG: SprT-like domain-containing protein [Acidobacteriota bacterium]|nr:SprT-like domain-containing protein [Acidobacteriota bacterium]
MPDNLNLIKNFYQSAFEKLDRQKLGAPEISVEFYPYVGLRHTIRIREGKVFVRLSDLSKQAPPTIHESLAFVLVSKLLRRGVPAAHLETYRNYAAQPEIGEQANNSRKARGRKLITTARGQVYDLEEIFRRVNKTYFQSRLEQPVLSWSQTKTRRVFGHQDAVHNTIIISRTLDDARVPQFVVEFVLYHELLHIVHPARIVNGKRRIHSAAFRRDERRFARFEEAEEWLEKLARQNRKRIKTQRR